MVNITNFFRILENIVEISDKNYINYYEKDATFGNVQIYTPLLYVQTYTVYTDMYILYVQTYTHVSCSIQNTRKRSEKGKNCKNFKSFFSNIM